MSPAALPSTMSTPRAPLLALAVALVAVLLAGPVAATAGDDGVVGTVTLTATASTPTLNDTDAVDSADTLTATNETVENTTEDVVGTTNDTVEDTTDLVDETVDTTTSSLDDSAEMLAGDILLDSSLSVEAELTAAAETGGTTASTETPAPESPTATPAVESATSAGEAGGLPIDGPAEPLLGGAMLGGVVALTGLAGRGLLLNGNAIRGPVRTASASTRNAVAGWRDRLGPLFGLLGYQRYDDSSPLDHDGRRRLAEAVRADPGVHLSAVSDRVALPLSTARYHLRILEHEGLVRGVKLRGKRRYFPPDVEAETLVASLADEATANVLRSLVDAGPASVSELAERLDRDPSTVSHHLDRLADEGLVERERAGRSVVSSATPEVEAAVDRLRSDEPVATARPAAMD